MGGGGLQDFSVSPSPLLGLFGFELGWTGLDWVCGDWGLRGWGLGLDNLNSSMSTYFMCPFPFNGFDLFRDHP